MSWIPREPRSPAAARAAGAAVSTSPLARSSWPHSTQSALTAAAYSAGAAGLGLEAIVHVQQYFSLFHEVRWIGPLFLANAVACIAAIVGLAYPRTRGAAAALGIVTSIVALASLVISYGPGLFGWQEAGWRTAIELIVIAEAGAAIFLTLGLAGPRIAA